MKRFVGCGIAHQICHLMVWCAIACPAMWWCGCGGGATDPVLKVKEMHYWSLPAEGARLPGPRSITTGLADDVVVLDTAGRVLVYDANGALKKQWWMPEVSVGRPEGVQVLKDGRVVVCDTHYHRVITFDPDGKVLQMFGQRGSGPGEFEYPVAVTADDQENLYIAEYGGNDRVQKFTNDGKFLRQIGRSGVEPGAFMRPSGLVWRAGKIYVADAVNNRVQRFADDGTFEAILGLPDQPLKLNLPYDITLGADGALYVVEYGAGRVTKINWEGRVMGRFGSTGTGEGQFNTPWGLTIDSRMRIHVGDTLNRRIVELVL
jgi:iron(III) transport system ATP-binding protein